MNAIFRFYGNTKNHPHKMAITDIKHGSVSFKYLEDLGTQTQNIIKAKGIKTGDAVLVAITPSPLLYGALCGLIGLGVKIVFIEPWLSLDRIDHIIESTKPKAFLTSALGKIWGFRSKQIRGIPHWITSKDITSQKITSFEVIDVPEEHPAFVVFSSGTTGKPKGVLRTHQYLEKVYQVFTALEPQDFDSPDLIIFPNVALFHLGTGRGSVIVPQRWTRKNLEKLLSICDKYKPETLSTSPSFLKNLVDLNILSQFSFLKRVVIGGALSDCSLLEKVFETLPDKNFIHLYGGSEAEPVTMMDAKQAVKLSRQEGFFQTLCLGKVIPQLKHKIRDEILWVTGPNVAGEYIGDPGENKGIKERDAQGNLWHNMGDRIIEKDEYLWFNGRSNQQSQDFILEQKIYCELQSSKSFIFRDLNKKIYLIGENLKKNKAQILVKFPQIDQIIESKIIRDKRHRSRIDRQRSLPKNLRSK